MALLIGASLAGLSVSMPPLVDGAYFCHSSWVFCPDVILPTWHGKKTYTSGPTPRPLAGDGEKNPRTFYMPGSPDLQKLCREAAGWLPVEPLPGLPRQSPAMAQDFFKARHQDQGEQPDAEFSLPLRLRATTHTAQVTHEVKA